MTKSSSSLDQLAHQIVGGSLYEGESDVFGVFFLLELADQLGNQVLAHGKGEANPDMTPVDVQQFSNVLAAPVQVAQAALDVFQVDLAIVGQADVPALFFKQGYAELFLNAADGVGEGRLGDAQLFGRLGHVFRFRQFDEET